MKDLVRAEQERRGPRPYVVPYREYRVAIQQIETLNERIAALEHENTFLSVIGPAAQRIRLRRFRR